MFLQSLYKIRKVRNLGVNTKENMAAGITTNAPIVPSSSSKYESIDDAIKLELLLESPADLTVSKDELRLKERPIT